MQKYSYRHHLSDTNVRTRDTALRLTFNGLYVRYTGIKNDTEPLIKSSSKITRTHAAAAAKKAAS
jgi:hypothetical protein